MAAAGDCKIVDLFSRGHRGCAGCGEGTAVRMILNEAGPDSIVSICTGCLEVMTTPYPETA
jgi:pyruvate ferredoxin oxidoreductase beta subunit